MPAGSHTRHDAIARTYDYFIHSYKDPVLGIFSSYYDLSNIDFGEMQKATQILGKHDDFRSICLTPDAHNTTICHVANTSIYLSENRERIQFSITANRFLRGMVRACVHFILEVGNGKMACEELDEMLAKKTPYHNKRTALPNGLYLAKVEYPYLSLETKESFGRMLRRGLSE
jgi:tRNA pseudouridine38-40 synthase